MKSPSLAALAALVLVVLSCSRPPEHSMAFFPDSSGMVRVVEVRQMGKVAGRYELLTRIAERRAERLGLQMGDPRHAGILGDWQLLADDKGLQINMPARNWGMDILPWPLPEAEALPLEPHPGLELVGLDWERVRLHSGAKARALRIDYILRPELLAQLELILEGPGLPASLWLVPDYGFHSFRIDQGYSEKRVQ